MSRELKTTFTINVPENEKPEFFGRMIDVFEDWLSDKGITPSDIPNPERDDNDDDAAIIYGDDYDYIADRLAEVLHLTR